MIIFHSKGSPKGMGALLEFAANSWRHKRTWELIGDMLAIQYYEFNSKPMWDLHEWHMPKLDYEFVMWEELDEFRYDPTYFLIMEFAKREAERRISD